VALTKVSQTTLYAIASTASNSVSVGAAVDISTYYAIDVRIRIGRGTGTAFTTAPKFRLEGTYDGSSPTADQWVTLAEFQCAVGASIGSQAVSGTEAAGQTVVTLAAGTNFAAGDYVFFHNATLANSEWSRVVSVSGADLTLEEGIVNAQTGATCRDQAEQYHALIDCTSLQQVRLVVDGNSTGQAVIVAADFGAVSGL
jgi:hypothetical protein